ncbi:MAG TPA: zinc ribbon domain-containing protein [Pyrinomonadaceae bacterium]|nr:zinc ribbon domain-containing protein [Pyrinomonadaceae bacterium]
MFCPQCGQQQATDEVRFCPRCGLQLGAVGGLLRSGGVAPERRFGRGEVESPRRRGVRQGVQGMALGAFLIPFFFVMHELVGTKDELAMLGILICFAGFLRLVYAFFEDAAAPRLAGGADDLAGQPAFARPGGRAAPELLAGHGVEARAYVPPRRDTADFSPRPSVIEGTTRRLGDERDEPR